jgi:hypothetical protein
MSDDADKSSVGVVNAGTAVAGNNVEADVDVGVFSAYLGNFSTVPHVARAARRVAKIGPHYRSLPDFGIFLISHMHHHRSYFSNVSLSRAPLHISWDSVDVY